MLVRDRGLAVLCSCFGEEAGLPEVETETFIRHDAVSLLVPILGNCAAPICRYEKHRGAEMTQTLLLTERKVRPNDLQLKIRWPRDRSHVGLGRNDYFGRKIGTEPSTRRMAAPRGILPSHFHFSP